MKHVNNADTKWMLDASELMCSEVVSFLLVKSHKYVTESSRRVDLYPNGLVAHVLRIND